jgi:hypothetical protein
MGWSDLPQWRKYQILNSRRIMPTPYNKPTPDKTGTNTYDDKEKDSPAEGRADEGLPKKAVRD